MSQKELLRAKRNIRNTIPDDIVNNAELNAAIKKLLPDNYNFEVHKTIARIRRVNAKRVALQMPEGLLLFSLVLVDILAKFSYDDELIEVFTMGDVAYGACCIDDFTSRAVNCDLLVHYGHSCLVQIEDTKTFYVFVDIKFDTKHLIDTVLANFDAGQHMVVVATIQFVQTLQAVRLELEKKYTVTIPQIAPLSPGEVLGCTSPTVPESDLILYLGDGRFHLESIMMANPSKPAYRYDPYTKVITREHYDHEQMRNNRFSQIKQARSAKTFGVIQGTLGRQGSPTVLDAVVKGIRAKGFTVVVILLSEIYPDKLRLYGDYIDAFIQTSCPRLSIDWGSFFTKPLLSPYEAAVAMDLVPWLPSGHYPMDFYAYESLGAWTPNYRVAVAQTGRRRHIVVGGTPQKDAVVQVPSAGEGECAHGTEGCSNCSCMFTG